MSGSSQTSESGNIHIHYRRITAADIQSDFNGGNRNGEVEKEAAPHDSNNHHSQSRSDTNPPSSSSSSSSPISTPTWYICAAPAARKQVLGWLAALKGPEGAVKTVYEDFGY